MPQGIQNPGFSESHVPHIRTYHTVSLRAVLCNFVLPLSFVPDSPRRSHLQLCNQCILYDEWLFNTTPRVHALSRGHQVWVENQEMLCLLISVTFVVVVVVSRYEEWMDVVHVNIVLSSTIVFYCVYGNEIYSTKIIVQIYKIVKIFYINVYSISKSKIIPFWFILKIFINRVELFFIFKRFFFF